MYWAVQNIHLVGSHTIQSNRTLHKQQQHDHYAPLSNHAK